MHPSRPNAQRKIVAVQVQALSYRHYRLPGQPMNAFDRLLQTLGPTGQRLLAWLAPPRPR